MSVKVNLLPSEVKQRGRENQARILAALVGLVFLLVLAGLTFLQRSSISDAEDRLASVQAENDALRADVTALQPFADLESRAAAAVDTVVLALSREASLASVLQDLSAVLPPTAELTSLSITFNEEPVAPAPGGNRVVYGSVAATGQVLEEFAPGVERLIIDVGRAAMFDNPYVPSSSVDENGVTSFSLEIQLGPEVLTERYEAAEAPS